MKKIVSALCLAISLAVGAAPSNTQGSGLLAPSLEQGHAAAMTAQLLTRFHYAPVALDDALSSRIFDRYLKALDPEKLFFLQADVDQFAFARDQLDDAIKARELTTPFAMFNIYQRRSLERMAHARSLLDQTMDFSAHERYFFQRDKMPWAQSEDELKDLWRKRVKNDWLRLKLAGKDDTAIRTTLRKRYDYALANMKRRKSEDVFQLFMNAYATSIEPHTIYLGPKATQEFDIAMRLSLVGIGAVLQERDDMTVIRELVPGGPAALSGKLKVGDRIVGIAQATDTAMTEVLGWRLDDVVQLLRGAQDTVVKISVLPADANPDGGQQVVSLVRKKVTFEQQAAKKSILTIQGAGGPRRIGVISLPTFYQDFAARQSGDTNFKSAARDVARLLRELHEEKVDGVLMDLRNNGGGALNEAVELANLFIGGGAVVQQRDARGKVRVESGSSARAVWEGPLGVLINRGSASASEIFAAAMQDYGRAVVVGETSFGKGTVQAVVNLDAVAKSETPKLGEVKMTVAQFYRVDGGTTQLRGVKPDIAFPSAADADSGESGFDNALPWGRIEATGFQVLGSLQDLLPLLQSRHEERVAKAPEFNFLKEDIAQHLLQRSQKSVSLNEAERRKERDVRADHLKSREALRRQLNGAEAGTSAERLLDDGLQANERSLNAELTVEKAEKSAKDLFLDEAAHILADELDLIGTSSRLAQQVLSGFSRSKAQ